MGKKIGDAINRIGIPTFAVGALLLVLLVTAALLGQSLPTLLTDILKRVGMNGVLVLAMLPAIKSGTGPNFALPIGIEGGLMALIICMQFDLSGWTLMIGSTALCIVFCTIMGYLYGKLMNAVKGAEMTIATYSGFSIVAFFNILWLAIPFSNRKMGWMLGTGLRETIQLKNFKASHIISDLFSFNVGGITIPVGMLLTIVLFCFITWLFFNTRTGMAIYAGGENPRYAEASGLNIDRNRIIANILSTILAGIGIIIYAQGYGYAQLYNGPMNMAFPAVAAVLVGGATAGKASIPNVLIGTCLFQGLMTTAMPVMNQIFTGTDLSDIMRIIVQNGVILYALTKVKSGGDR
ncbi:MAG: ABC transporter permease [Clostridium sp.]|nr:ABC transporter permease [Clostridium sp.]MBO6149802.1 ABC transporter permease [Clostridium sp.]